MKIKMLEHFQGAGASGILLRTGVTVNALEPGEVYEVAEETAAYLLENRKAEEVEEAPHYGAQAKPELRDDEALYKRMTEVAGVEDETEAEFEPLVELTEENAKEEKVSKPKAKRGKK
jgi:hypothetical protein